MRVCVCVRACVCVCVCTRVRTCLYLFQCLTGSISLFLKFEFPVPLQTIRCQQCYICRRCGQCGDTFSLPIFPTLSHVVVRVRGPCM